MKRSKKRRGRGLARRRGRGRGRRTPRLIQDLQRLFHEKKSRIRPAVTAATALLVGGLILLFAVRGDTNALYVLLLSSGASLLFLWALPNWKLGLTAVFLFTQPLLIYLGNTEYGYTKAIYSLGFISLLWVLWVGEAALRGRIELRLPPLLGPGLAILGAALLSLLNSNSFLADVQYVVLIVYFMAFFLYLANTLKDSAEVRFLVGALLGAAGLASGYGLLQYYGLLPGTPGVSQGTGAIISTFGNKNYLGGFLAYLLAPGLVFLYLSPSRWGKLFAVAALGVTFVTLVAISSDSAWLAMLLSLGMLAGGIALTGRWESIRKAGMAHGGMVVLAALLTALLLGTTVAWLWNRPFAEAGWARLGRAFSPLGWLGLGALGGLLGLAGVPRLLTHWRGQRLPRWVGIGALVVLALAVGFFLATPPGRATVDSLRDLAVKSSAKVRTQDWWIAYHMFQEQPLIGVGLGDYKREFLPYKAKFLRTERGQRYAERVGYLQRAAQAHNEYVQILAEMGVVGGFALVFFLVVLVRSAWRRLRANASSVEGSLWAAGLSAGTVAFLSDSLFSFPLHLPANALLFAFLLGALSSPALGAPSRTVSLGVQGTRVLAGVVVGIAMIVSVFAYRDWLADTYLDRGMRAAKLREDTEAKRLLEKSVELDFAPAEAFYWLGTIALREGDPERARDYFEQMLPRFTTESGYYQLALVYFQLGEYEKSREYLDLLLAMDPSPTLKPEALYLQVTLISRLEGPEAALSQVEELVKRYPNEEKLWVALAQLYLAQGERERAKVTLEKTLRLVNRKLKALDRRLQPGRALPLDDYARWTAERESLRKLRDELERALRRLSAGSP